MIAPCGDVAKGGRCVVTSVAPLIGFSGSSGD